MTDRTPWNAADKTDFGLFELIARVQAWHWVAVSLAAAAAALAFPEMGSSVLMAPRMDRHQR
jgi:hypothetical protein